jgi:hypothetical protein
MAMYQETDKAPYAPAVLEANTESLKRQVWQDVQGYQDTLVACLICTHWQSIWSASVTVWLAVPSTFTLSMLIDFCPCCPQVERGLYRGTSLEAFKLLLNVILLQVGRCLLVLTCGDKVQVHAHG